MSSFLHQQRTSGARDEPTDGGVACRTCGDTRRIVRAEGLWARALPCPACVTPCTVCNGAGVLLKTDWTGQLVSRPCPCFVESRNLRRFNEALIPRRYVEADLLRFDDRGIPSLQDAKVALVQLAHGFQAGRRGVGLSGPTGSGKTHLLAALARHLTLEHGVEVRMVEFTHLLGDLRARYERGESTAALLDDLVRVPLLILDELGKGGHTEWQLGILDELISRRYNLDVTTCFATNHPFFEATERWDRGARSQGQSYDAILLAQRIGERIFSRLCEMCDLIRIDAPDWRQERQRDAGRPTSR
jgi:DNA replication protein DnaC